MSTPNSFVGVPPNTNYMTNAQFLVWYDWRTVADLVSDTGVRLTQSTLSTTSATSVLTQIIASACGMVEAACLRATNYQPADLALIAGLVTYGAGLTMNGTPAQGLLFQIIADLTMGLLIRRRPDKKLPIPPAFLAAMDWLEQLGAGERIFGLVEHQTAGSPVVYQELDQDVQNRNLIDVQAHRFFGRRVNQSQNFPW